MAKRVQKGPSPPILFLSKIAISRISFVFTRAVFFDYGNEDGLTWCHIAST